jgi:hypothetical protein
MTMMQTASLLRLRARARRVSGTLGALAALSLLSCGENQTRSPQNAAFEGGAPAPLACVPNLDGKIDANELAPAFGVEARYLVNPAGESRTVDLAGRVDANGVRVWDYSTPFVDDRIATIVAQKPDDKWYAGSFPGAEFVTPLDLAGTTVSIYARTPEQIRLLGLASTDPDPPDGKTLLVYDPPVVLYELPLVPGSTHTSTGTTKNATLRGQPYAGRDTYEVSVDAAGKLVLPDITFTQALRVRTRVTVEPIAGEPRTQRQVSFFFECFGEVARATSADGEPAEDFSNATELRRLGLSPAE